MLKTRFNDVVTSVAQLEELLGTPSSLVLRKKLGQLDEHMRTFISLSPFMLLATTNTIGQCDVSPRGDPNGFVQILDERTLILPERPGNRLVDSLRNIIEQPQVGLLFMIPDRCETLRVNGEAYIIRDENIRLSLSVQGKPPPLAIAVNIEECFIHCARSLLRAKLWQPESWGNPDKLAGIAQMIVDQVQLTDVDVEELQASYDEDNKTLY